MAGRTGCLKEILFVADRASFNRVRTVQLQRCRLMDARAAIVLARLNGPRLSSSVPPALCIEKLSFVRDGSWLVSWLRLPRRKPHICEVDQSSEVQAY